MAEQPQGRHLAGAAIPAAQPGVSVAAVGPRPSPVAPLLLWGTILLGFAGLACGLATARDLETWRNLPPLLALALVAEFMTVSFFESDKQRMSLSFTAAVVMAAVALAPAVAPLIAVSAALVHVVQQRQWRRGIGRVLFNLADPALAAVVAAGCARLAGIERGGWVAALAITVATLAYYVVNVGVIAVNIAAHTRNPLRQIVRDSLWSAPTTIMIGLIGGFVGVAHGRLGLLGMILFVLPLLVLRFTLAYAARKNRQAIATLERAKGEIEWAHAEKEQTLRQMIATVAAIIDARDQAVAGHSGRVARYAQAIGEHLGLSPHELDQLHTAGLLHDLGKIAIPEGILHKPARLTAEEYAIVKEHAATGERILAQVAALQDVARMVGDHHERFDGRGYPDGEVGMAITLGGRILAVADTLDTILSDRPYSPAKPLAWALEEAERCAGSHFDPAVVAALQRVVAARGPAFFETAARPAPAQDVVVDPFGVLLPFLAAQADTPAAALARD
jgi:putative nucleotidyltransferase with HDIG domain